MFMYKILNFKRQVYSSRLILQISRCSHTVMHLVWPQFRIIYTTQLFVKCWEYSFLIFCTFCARPYSKQLLQSDNVSLTVFCVLYIK